MFNSLLYAIFRNPALVRLAKGALAAAVSAGITYIVTGLTNADPAVIPPILIPTLTALLLAVEKWLGEWAKPPVA